MRLQDLHGACGFIVFDASFLFGTSFSRVCRAIAECPGVVFTDRRHFFWSAESIRAEFTFAGHEYLIEPDPWEDGIRITPKDKEANCPEIQQIKAHIESASLSK